MPPRHMLRRIVRSSRMRVKATQNVLIRSYVTSDADITEPVDTVPAQSKSINWDDIFSEQGQLNDAENSVLDETTASASSRPNTVEVSTSWMDDVLVSDAESSSNIATLNDYLKSLEERFQTSPLYNWENLRLYADETEDGVLRRLTMEFMTVRRIRGWLLGVLPLKEDPLDNAVPEDGTEEARALVKFLTQDWDRAVESVPSTIPRLEAYSKELRATLTRCQRGTKDEKKEAFANLEKLLGKTTTPTQTEAKAVSVAEKTEEAAAPLATPEAADQTTTEEAPVTTEEASATTEEAPATTAEESAEPEIVPPSREEIIRAGVEHKNLFYKRLRLMQKYRKMLLMTDAEWEHTVIDTILRNTTIESRRELLQEVDHQDLFVTDPLSLQTVSVVKNAKYINPSLIERVHTSLLRPYAAMSYLTKDKRAELEGKIAAFEKAQNDLPVDKRSPLPEELQPYATLMRASAEERRRIENQQYINKLVPPENGPLHLMKPTGGAPVTATRREWQKSQRELLRDLIKKNEQRLSKRWKEVKVDPKRTPRQLPLAWRAAYKMHIQRIGAELHPGGSEKVAFESYDYIRSNFAELLDLKVHRRHLELYLTGLAMYWDWTKARALFMKKYRTLWNPHGEIVDQGAILKPISIMMRALVYRKRSFEELLAMHSLVADMAANQMLEGHGRRPSKEYYDSVLKMLVKERNWELAKKWFIHFYQTTLYNRQPAPTSHIIPDVHSYTILLRGARCIPKVASVEAHLIMSAARHDSLRNFASFAPSAEMIGEVMLAHISDGDGDGAATTFTKVFQTPFSNGAVSFTDLTPKWQRELLLHYFEGLALKRDMNQVYRALTALYQFDPEYLNDTAFHNEIMERLTKYSYSCGVHFFKNIFRIRGRMHLNPVHPDFYTFEKIMGKAVFQRRFLFARGLYNLVPHTMGPLVKNKLKSMTGLALKPAVQVTYKRDIQDQL